MIAAAAIAVGTWPQQVRRRPTLLCIGCATTESDWLAFVVYRPTSSWLRHRVLLLSESLSLSKWLSWRLSDSQIQTTCWDRIWVFGLTISLSTQRKVDLVCDLARSPATDSLPSANCWASSLSACMPFLYDHVAWSSLMTHSAVFQCVTWLTATNRWIDCWLFI